MNDKASIMTSQSQRLRVSAYDRASSTLLALLIFMGSSVLLLLVIWLSSKIFIPQIAVPVALTEIGEGDGGGDGRPTGGTQLDVPTFEAIPGLPVDNSPPVKESIEAAIDTVAVKASQMDEQLDDPSLVVRLPRGDYGTGGGMGGGTGPGRGLGHGPGKGGIRRRWELQFLQGGTLELYGKQLDFFRIELGVLMPGGKVVYASNLSKPKPDTRTGPSEKEKRYYLTWRGGELQQADRELLARAGVDSTGLIILKLLPPPVEAQLAKLERAHANREPKDIVKTRFGIRAEGKGYGFYVLEQVHKQ